MIVQPGEKNIYDQRLIETVLFQNWGIKILRYTLNQISQDAILVGAERRLMMYIFVSHFQWRT